MAYCWREEEAVSERATPTSAESCAAPELLNNFGHTLGRCLVLWDALAGASVRVLVQGVVANSKAHLDD